jgi:hypothetical protein
VRQERDGSHGTKTISASTSKKEEPKWCVDHGVLELEIWLEMNCCRQ